MATRLTMLAYLKLENVCKQNGCPPGFFCVDVNAFDAGGNVSEVRNLVVPIAVDF
jgi:hypothetical protein